MGWTKMTQERANVLWEQYDIAQAAICDEVEAEGYDPDSMYFEMEVAERERELRKQFPWKEMVEAIRC